MSRPLSPVDVYNLALDYHKEAPISSVENPQTKTEALCARWGDHSRRLALRLHSWNFATKRVELALLSEAPAFQYTQAFKLPTDFVRLVSVGERGTIKNYQLEDSKILTEGEEAPLPIKYIYDFTNVARMDALFIDMWALILAIRISYPLTGSSERGQVLENDLEAIATQAFAVDGQERPPDRIERSRYRSRMLEGMGGFGSRRDPRYLPED